MCVLRGGGDLATGVAWQLRQKGLPVVVLELPEPLTVRRTVALSTAVAEGEITVQGMRGVLVDTPAKALATARAGDVAVLVASELAQVASLRPDVLVDARMVKRDIDTSRRDARLVIGLGPGFRAKENCHAVVETMRGPDLGKLITSGPAQPDTGTPAELGGRSADRVVRAPADGRVEWRIAIGDVVTGGQPLGEVDGVTVRAPFDGVGAGRHPHRHAGAGRPQDRRCRSPWRPCRLLGDLRQGPGRGQGRGRGRGTSQDPPDLTVSPYCSVLGPAEFLDVAEGFEHRMNHARPLGWVPWSGLRST